MGMPDQLICLLRNLYADQDATVRIPHEAVNWFKIGKKYIKAVYRHLAYLTYMQSISYEMLGWMAYNVESRLLGEISTNSLRYAESEEELKSLLRVKEENEKAGLKLNIQKTKIMPFGSITSWQMGKKWKQWLSGAPKSLWMVSAAMKLKDACSLEGKVWQT